MKDNFIEENLETSKSLDDFVLYHDPYEYSDVGVDRDENLNRIQGDLEVGNTKHIKDFLQDIESDHPDYEEAQNILQQIDNFEATYYSDELVIKINNEFIEIHQCDEGFDYSIYNHQYKHLDGGVYDDNEATIYGALREIMEDDSMIPLK